MNDAIWVAHRGWQQHWPENTLLAIQQAIAVGAKNIEIDVQLSADQQAVLLHDLKLRRLTGQKGNVCKKTWAELQALSAHEPQRFGERFLGNRLAHLQDCIKLLAQHPDVTLYLEIKQHSLQHHGYGRVINAILPLLEPIARRCVIISFDMNVLVRLQKRHWPRLGLVLSNWGQWQQTDIAALAPECVFCDIDLVPAMDSIPDCPYPMIIYEVTDPQLAASLVSAGAQGIETFDVGKMLGRPLTT